MDLDEIKETATWQLYEKGKNFLRQNNVYSDTDRNYRFYNGNQWEGAKIEGIEQAQYNFIETIVNYKVSTINQNLWAINYSSENFDTKEFRQTAEDTCDMLNRKAAKVWEKDQMDYKVRVISDDAAINDEGLIYVDYNDETQDPINEILNKNNVQFGNEQSSDIQSQPYILISQRLPVSTCQMMAEQNGASQEDIKYIVGDNVTFEEAGDDSKYEKDDMCTLVTKLWKQDGTVHYSKATRFVDLQEDEDTGLTLYPVAHFIWKEKKGWSRGEGEVRSLIPNQLELNKTLARVLLSTKNCAFPQKVANMDKIANPEAINTVGGTIKVMGGNSVDDVNRIFGYVQPTTMSSDVNRLMTDLIQITRDLKNSGDIATGGINPEQASGKAILAIQEASQQPLVKQLTGLKRFIEDLARIWLDMWTVYTPDGMTLEEEITDPMTDESVINLVDIPSSVLENLQGTVKVDITPKGAFDKYARELSLENYLKEGFFTAQRVNELKYYAEALPDDATAPKQKLLEICEKIEAEQARIAEINAQAQMMQQRYNSFIGGSPEEQADTINQAMATNNMENGAA
ncbi:MAG: hypothetical protein II625_06580 [Bacilli bacterium]|nr:hypothetical protein [Bacilli bacterium]